MLICLHFADPLEFTHSLVTNPRRPLLMAKYDYRTGKNTESGVEYRLSCSGSRRILTFET